MSAAPISWFVIVCFVIVAAIAVLALAAGMVALIMLTGRKE